MKVRKKKAKGSEKALKSIAAQRGLDRKEFFANGGTALEWKGGASHTFIDRRAEKNRRACRERTENE